MATKESVRKVGPADWKVIRALWAKSQCRSDFRALVAYNATEVSDTKLAFEWAAQQEHPTEIGREFVENKKWMD